MNRIKWTEKITNAEVLRKTGVNELELLNQIKSNKKKFIGLKKKNDRLFAVASSGIIVGKSPRGRKRKSMLSEE